MIKRTGVQYLIVTLAYCQLASYYCIHLMTSLSRLDRVALDFVCFAPTFFSVLIMYIG